MNKNKIIEQLREVDYIFDFLENDFECTQECDNCPASKACTQMSNNGNYEVFKTNYRALKLYEEFNHDN